MRHSVYRRWVFWQKRIIKDVFEINAIYMISLVGDGELWVLDSDAIQSLLAVEDALMTTASECEREGWNDKTPDDVDDVDDEEEDDDDVVVVDDNVVVVVVLVVVVVVVVVDDDDVDDGEDDDVDGGGVRCMVVFVVVCVVLDNNAVELCNVDVFATGQ